MATHVEPSGEKIISDRRRYDVRKIFGAGGSDHDIALGSQDLTQRVLRRQAAKDIAGADEQDATHVEPPDEEIDWRSIANQVKRVTQNQQNINAQLQFSAPGLRW